MSVALAASFLAVAAASAADNPPDINMLLNLDLFGASRADSPADTNQSASMLDQIRTLDAMGFLDGAGPGNGQSYEPDNAEGTDNPNFEGEDETPQP